MKITSLSVSTAPEKPLEFVAPDKGPAYQAWQERWKAYRTKDWEWSKVPDAMAAEAVEAMAEDLQARCGKDALTTSLHILVALCMELPEKARTFKFILPDAASGEDDSADRGVARMQSTLEFTMVPSVEGESEGDEASVGLTLVAENPEDTARLERLGVLDKSARLPADEAMRLIDEAAERGNKETRSEAVRWNAAEVRAALVAGERAWPDMSSPLQAYPVVTGWLLHQSAIRQGADESSIAFDDVTFGRRMDGPAQDVRLSIAYKPAAPASKPVRGRGPR